MATDRLPPGLAPSSGSLNFTEDTVPDALQQEHTLAPGRWGVLHVFEGSVRFVNLETGDERDVSSPDLIIIYPKVPHRLQLTGRLRCRVDFFRELDDDATMRTPGSFASDEVYLSFQRCEATGDFADTFYNAFLNSSPEIAPHFAKTDFAETTQAAPRFGIPDGGAGRSGPGDASIGEPSWGSTQPDQAQYSSAAL